MQHLHLAQAGDHLQGGTRAGQGRAQEIMSGSQTPVTLRQSTPKRSTGVAFVPSASCRAAATLSAYAITPIPYLAVLQYQVLLVAQQGLHEGEQQGDVHVVKSAGDVNRHCRGKCDKIGPIVYNIRGKCAKNGMY